MTFNEDRTKFYCKECKKWVSIFPCEYLLLYNSVQCMNLHHNGFYHDIFPCEHYYLYHSKGQCRCIQEETDCFGNEEECSYILARLCFEADKKEK
jgi:hypothetical protein